MVGYPLRSITGNRNKIVIAPMRRQPELTRALFHRRGFRRQLLALGLYGRWYGGERRGPRGEGRAPTTAGRRSVLPYLPNYYQLEIR